MGNWIGKITTGLMLFLAVPSSAILITWNTLPGEPLYPVKRGLENVALVILSPSFKAKSSLQAELIGRRTTEATKVLVAQNSSQGLTELRTQVQSATLETAAAKDPQAQAEAATKLIAKLEETNKVLETSKTTIKQTPTTTNTYTPPTPTTIQYQPPQTPTTTQPESPQPTPTPTTRPSTPVPTGPAPVQQVAEINNTQQEIKQQIRELEVIRDQAEIRKQENEERKEQRQEERQDRNSNDNKGKGEDR